MNTYAEILVYCSHAIFKRVRKTVYNMNTSYVAVLIEKINTRYDVRTQRNRTHYVKKGALDITSSEESFHYLNARKKWPG
jgi:hypothetical protein